MDRKRQDWLMDQNRSLLSCLFSVFWSPQHRHFVLLAGQSSLRVTSLSSANLRGHFINFTLLIVTGPHGHPDTENGSLQCHDKISTFAMSGIFEIKNILMKISSSEVNQHCQHSFETSLCFEISKTFLVFFNHYCCFLN